MFARLFGRKTQDAAARALYEAAVRQGREPAFYSDLGVPDTLDGRFECISLQVWLLMRRLGRADSEGRALSQGLAEVFFADMDLSLREIGAADIGVGRRVKRMIEGFYGRVGAYDEGLAAAGAGEPAALDAALARNLYGTLPESDPARRQAVVRYLLAADEALGEQPDAEILAGRPAFPEPAAFVGGSPDAGAAA